MPRPRKLDSPFRCFNSSPEVIRLVVMMYVRFPLSLRNVEDLLFERGIDLCHEGTVRANALVVNRPALAQSDASPPQTR
jgi:putative transposase